MNYFPIIEINTIPKGASSEIVKDTQSLNHESIRNWLINKKIVSENDSLIGYRDLNPWIRSGGETFCTSFEVITTYEVKTIIIKALITTFPEQSLIDWTRRRALLQYHKIPVSNWYYYGNAVIIEDFYPNSIEAVQFEKLLEIGYKLDSLGFTTFNFLDDIKVDKKGDPFYIDFGYDLGEPSSKVQKNALNLLLKKYPTKQCQIKEYYELI